MSSGTLVLYGGGIDSTVAAWEVAYRFPEEDVTLLYFDYGARARKREWAAAEKVAVALPNRCNAIKVPFGFFKGYTNSSLTGDSEVERNPQKGIAYDWVPARNTVFVALALSYAESHEMNRIVTGINSTAAIAYPDNDYRWQLAMEELIPWAVSRKKSAKITLISPLMHRTKAEIVKLGNQLSVPWFNLETWSCYNGGKKQCGECSSCLARIDAFALASVYDPTEYE